MTFPTALAAPVEDGMILAAAPRPPRQSLFDGPSTVYITSQISCSPSFPNEKVHTFWVAVVACTVVMRPSMIPNLSCNTLASGARQFVVQEAFEIFRHLSISFFSNRFEGIETYDSI